MSGQIGSGVQFKKTHLSLAQSFSNVGSVIRTSCFLLVFHSPLHLSLLTTVSDVGLRPGSLVGQHHPGLLVVQAFGAQSCSAVATVTPLTQ